jgi:hypothetical protein
LDPSLFAFIYLWASGWLEGVLSNELGKSRWLGWGKVFKSAAFCAQKITQVCG